MTAQASDLLAKIAKLWNPPPRLTVSEWADTYRVLPEGSAEPGKWRTDRAPYQREIMDALFEEGVHVVAVMASSQVGKSDGLLNFMFRMMHLDPCPMLMVQPTIFDAEDFSIRRITPSINATPVLAEILPPTKGRDSNNKMLSKFFPGGSISLVGSNSASGLASRPIRGLLFDEVDRYEASASGEGDPIKVAMRRKQSFWNWFALLFSTPKLKGSSRIEKAFEEGDQRRFFVPCPHCDHFHVLNFKTGMRWPEGHPEEAYFECPNCKGEIRDQHRSEMLRRGYWQATATAKILGTVSFHIWQAYSPWGLWADIALEFWVSKDDPELLQVFINTVLGETWEANETRRMSSDALIERAEAEPDSYVMGTVPDGVLLITAGVDVQHNRVAMVIRGFGRGEESWLLWTGELFGDPSGDQLWADLDECLSIDFIHPRSSKRIPISLVLVDSNYKTHEVYNYTRDRKRKGVFASRGLSTAGKPIVGKLTKVDFTYKGKVIEGGASHYPIGPDTGKNTISSRIQIPSGSKSYHWAKDTPTDYFKQLTCEKLVTRYRNGFPYTRWEKVNGERNEAFDCEVLCYAAALLCGVARKNWAALEQKYATMTGKTVQPKSEEAEEPHQLAPTPTPTAAPKPRIAPKRPVREGFGTRRGR